MNKSHIFYPVTQGYPGNPSKKSSANLVQRLDFLFNIFPVGLLDGKLNTLRRKRFLELKNLKYINSYAFESMNKSIYDRYFSTFLVSSIPSYIK